MRTRSMRGPLARRGVVGVAALVAALVLGVAGVMPAAAVDADGDPGEATPLSVPGMSVSSAQAGELALWGDNGDGQLTIPASLDGVAISQLVLPANARLVLTADGRVVGWGTNESRLEAVPAEVAAAEVAQIATQGDYAGAVTGDGTVLMWGKQRSLPTPLDVPAGLSGVKQLALTEFAGAALKQDGSVVAWGRATYGETDVPAGLKATAITATNSQFFALTEQGTVTAWGQDTSGSVPAALQQPGNVKAIATTRVGGVALLADNTLASFGLDSGTPTIPTEVAAADPALLANSSGTSEFAIVDRDRTIHYWSNAGPAAATPDELNGRALVQIVIGSQTGDDPSTITGGVLITKLLRVELPQVTGTRAVGGTLTATPGTFSASPDTVTGQWLADGAELPGQTDTTLSVTSELAGKQVSYQSTATKTGETAISSTSETVGVPAPATVALSVAQSRYGNATTVTASVGGAAGNVSLTVDGKPAGTKTLVDGKASFSVARTTTPGNHAVQATYAGGDTFGPGSTTGTLRVGKGRTSTPTLRVVKAGPKKLGTVTVPTAVGLVKATGKALLVLKQAKTTKRLTLTVSNGKATGKLPKLRKGTWTATVTYQGNTYYLASGTKTIRFKSK